MAEKKWINESEIPPKKGKVNVAAIAPPIEDADWIVISDVISTIDRLEEQGQLIRPVANVLRKTLGAKTPEEKPFELKYKEPALDLSLLNAVKKTVVNEKELKKLSKAGIAAALILANGEMNDVRLIAERYRGLVGAEGMSVGAIHLLEVQTRENDMREARKLIGEYFYLNETQTDNLGNQGSVMVKHLLNRFDCFTDEVRRAMYLLDLAIETFEDNGDRPKKLELLGTVRALFNMALHNKGECRIE